MATDRRELFLEIGCEELPSGYIDPALAALRTGIEKGLTEALLEHGAVSVYGTPRRLCAVVDVAASQADEDKEVTGPAEKVAFDPQGQPTKAAQAFAQKCGIPVGALTVVDTPKGRYLSGRVQRAGQQATAILPPMLDAIIPALPFPRSMRWGSGPERFARPMHWIVAILGGDVLPVSFGRVKAGNQSRGHRFHAPAQFEVHSAAQHAAACEAARVIVDGKRRLLMVHKLADEAAGQVGGTIRRDDSLAYINANLVEWPVAVLGHFDPLFMELPEPVLQSEMREHQRYFAVEGPDGRLLPHFVAISNTLPRDLDLVRMGNERVLRARFEDGRFYFRTDKAKPLADMTEELRGVVFHRDLGTSYAKMERFRALALDLGRWLGSAPEGSEERKRLDRAAFLCKADLVSGMVGEFPELQGLMGRDYALAAGEDRSVAAAIADHYRPRSADDSLPDGDLGATVGIADRMDTLVGMFAIGQPPTGAADPFALRRGALAILRILLDRRWQAADGGAPVLPLLVDGAIAQLAPVIDALRERNKPAPGRRGKTFPEPSQVRADVLEFFRGRLPGLWADQAPADVIDAVLGAGFEDPVDAAARLTALAAYRRRDDFMDLAVAFKRAANLAKDAPTAPVDPARFVEPAEQALWDAATAARTTVEAALRGRPDGAAYTAALAAIGALRPAVDRLFGEVFVMDKDEAVRNNRLAMLYEIKRLVGRIADFTRLAVDVK